MTLLKVTQRLAGINMLHHYHNILTDTLVQGSITQNPTLFHVFQIVYYETVIVRAVYMQLSVKQRLLVYQMSKSCLCCSCLKYNSSDCPFRVIYKNKAPCMCSNVLC